MHTEYVHTTLLIPDILYSLSTEGKALVLYCSVKVLEPRKE